jgi:hypothetical protein
MVDIEDVALEICIFLFVGIPGSGLCERGARGDAETDGEMVEGI